MEDYAGVPIIGVVVMPNYPEEYVALVRVCVQGIEAALGDAHFLVNCPEAFRQCFAGMFYQMIAVTDNSDPSGRVINNDFIAVNSSEVVVFANGDTEFDTEISVLQMKMYSLQKRVTKHVVTVRHHREAPEGIPF